MHSPCLLNGLTLHQIQYCNTEATPMGRLVAMESQVALEGSSKEPRADANKLQQTSTSPCVKAHVFTSNLPKYWH